MNPIKHPDKSSPPTVILAGLTRGLGCTLFEQLRSQAYPIVGLGRDLRRIEAVAKSASARIGLIEVDLAADSNALEESLTALGRLLSATSTGPLPFISATHQTSSLSANL